MPGPEQREILVQGAREHNLQGFDLAIPRGWLTVVTGVSGSGKSSLAFDTLFREGQRRFLETLPSFSRQFLGAQARPEVAGISGLGPAVAVGQRTGSNNPRSTVGTLTEVWDLLRLLYARLGQGPEGVQPTRGLFSFNGAEGACPGCQGLGVEDALDLDLLLADPARTLRQGALRVSLPNGYLMYSQVTLEVLDQVLRAHGGSVDIPWRDLGDEARRVVLHGSDRLKVPYGKHPLESRLKWTGITARPRREGFYLGLVPVMEEILRGKRNPSILRFVRTSPCAACGGTRLGPEARSVLWRGRGIAELAAMAPERLMAFLGPEDPGDSVAAPILRELRARCGLMEELGLGGLSFDRGVPGLALGETRRLRLLTLAMGELRGLLVVLDEPSAGLHPHEVGPLIRVLHRLRDQGQTVVVVEHDAAIARAADWLVDLGPGPGAQGGRLLFSGPPSELPRDGSPTSRWLHGEPGPLAEPRPGTRALRLEGLERHNLRQVDLELALPALNVITGVSGSGKTSLLQAATGRLAGDESFARIVTVDADPIGRTPRSNPATYSGAFDLIRDLFAATAEARAARLGKGHFSFNTPGGRCETCEGAGVVEVGMRHLGTVTRVCEACAGRRFRPEVLAVKLRGRSISDLLEGSVTQAADHFALHPRLTRILSALLDCGLGYLPLGQPATTLSGGEAQRVKLATELARAGAGAALIALDEPTAGLHPEDVHALLDAWDRLIRAGHTLLAADNDPAVVRAADRITDLGPGSGSRGGRVVAAGSPSAIRASAGSLTGAALRGEGFEPAVEPAAFGPEPPMTFTDLATHNLRIPELAFPARGLTVVTGPSGCGKSSLVIDTLLAEARNRFSDLVAPWARRLLPRKGGAEFSRALGLLAAVSVAQGGGRRNPRSRAGTVSELDERLRMLFSRAGARPCPACGRLGREPRCACGAPVPVLLASAFSPNAEASACPVCKGLGLIQACDPLRLVVRPQLPLDGGAMDGTRYGAYLGEPDGQHVALLRAAGLALGLDFSPPWDRLGPREREVAMAGAGDRVFEADWHFRRGAKAGVHRLSSPWAGFAVLVDREYERTHGAAKGEALESLMADRPCPACDGEWLKPAARAVVFAGKRLPEALGMTFRQLAQWLQAPALPAADLALTAGLRQDLLRRLGSLLDAGLGYVAPDREMATLSSGEAQRLRLASALGAGLSGVAYVLDEPTRGLHALDVVRLTGVLKDLADQGNAVVVVAHDPQLVAQADHVIELGPGAGPEGGRLMAQGAPAALAEDPRAPYVGRLLRPRPALAAPAVPFVPGVTVRGAFLHNLRDLDLVFPSASLVVVTGVSGSGKSSLVQGVLGASLRSALLGRGAVGCGSLEWQSPIREVAALDQDPPAAGGRSTVATLAGAAGPLRNLFAASPSAKAGGLTARHFSTAAPGGRCEACQGLGVITVAMDLLPDVTMGCEACQGRRFLPRVLVCRVAGLTIADALDATLAEASAAFPALAAALGPAEAMGLGYLRLGQGAQALSAGERQRLRLAALMGTRAPAAFLLDEPALGLGAGEVERLARTLHGLARAGHLVVAVEHDLDLIRAADWVIDLGPGGGDAGGWLMVAGTPAEVAMCEASATGRALGRALG